MEVDAAQSSWLQSVMQNSRRLQPMRFIFLVVIFLQLYLSNSVSLPSICGILLSCAVYTIYVDIKAKRSPEIRSLPSPSTLDRALPPLSSAALSPDVKNTRSQSPDVLNQSPSLPLEPSSLKYVREGAPLAHKHHDSIDQKQQPQQDPQKQQQQQQQLPSRSQGLSISAAPWEPTILRSSSSSLNCAKPTSAASSTSASQPPTSTIFVGNMSSVVTESDLMQMFSPFGDIIVARIQRGTKQKGLKMFAALCSAVSFLTRSHFYRFIGFVDFYVVESAVAALRSLQGVSLCGRPMRLEFSQVAAQTLQPHQILTSKSYASLIARCRRRLLLPSRSWAACVLAQAVIACSANMRVPLAPLLIMRCVLCALQLQSLILMFHAALR